MNKVILIGRMTSHPELSRSAAGQAIARYRLAVDREYKMANEKTATDFISCVAFGQTAEFAGKYLSRGQKIAIEGRLNSSSYEGKDGRMVYVTNVVVERQEFCGPAKGHAMNGPAPEATGAQQPATPAELPASPPAAAPVRQSAASEPAAPEPEGNRYVSLFDLDELNDMDPDELPF